MKKILTVILASVTSLALAQEKANLSRSIDDNGRNLSIRVSGYVNGRPIKYNRTFEVEGLDKSERTAIADRILDSLGVGKVEHPLAPMPPFQATSNYNSMSVTANNSSPYKSTYSPEVNNHQTKDVAGNSPLNKEVWLDEHGFLRLRYSFTRCNEEFIYEKSTDAGEKSESEREKFIKDFEREIELPAI